MGRDLILFVDASVIVAIVQQEQDAGDLMDRLQRDGGPYYVSSVVRMEASLALARRLAEARGRDQPATTEMVAMARTLVDQFIVDIDAREIMIGGDIGTKALDAAQQYGKVINHAARLNMGDCFAYACASENR